MDLDAEEALNDAMEAFQNAGTKRCAREDPLVVPAHSRQKTVWTPTGRIVPNLGRGDCLFHAIAQGLTEYGEVGSSGTPRSYRQLRAVVTGTFKKYPTEYGELWANQGRIDPQGKMQSEKASFDRYVQEIATRGTWSGALELSAYCENTATEAWVVSDREVFQFNRHGRQKGLHFRHKDNHFELIAGAVRDEWVARKLEQDEAGGKKLPPSEVADVL